MSLIGKRDDWREALRRIRGNPCTTFAAVSNPALGIGAATAIFTVAHAYLIAPPPFRDAD